MNKIRFGIMALLLFFVCGIVFAQGAKSTGLTDGDIKSFCKNYEKILSDLEEYDSYIQANEIGSIVIADSVKPKVSAILNKHGISGKNSAEKFQAIICGYAFVTYEDAISANPQTAVVLKAMGIDPISMLRPLVSDSDCAVIKKHADELSEVLTEDYEEDYEEEDEPDAGYSDFSEYYYKNLYNDEDCDEIGDYDDCDEDDELDPEFVKKVLKKYDVKKKFKVYKNSSGDKVVIVSPSDYVFENSSEARVYAENYQGEKKSFFDWSADSNSSYLEEIMKGKDYSVWDCIEHGVSFYKYDKKGKYYYLDKTISDADLTPEIRKNAYLIIGSASDAY